MVGNYTIWLGNEPVGEVTVVRQGLYYCFTCHCQVHSKVIYRVCASCGGKHESLGILTPDGSGYSLTKKMPVSRFLPGSPEFWLAPKQTNRDNIYIDIYPEEPFRYITRLEKAYLDKGSGKIVIATDNEPYKIIFKSSSTGQ